MCIQYNSQYDMIYVQQSGPAHLQHSLQVSSESRSFVLSHHEILFPRLQCSCYNLNKHGPWIFLCRQLYLRMSNLQVLSPNHILPFLHDVMHQVSITSKAIATWPPTEVRTVLPALVLCYVMAWHGNLVLCISTVVLMMTTQYTGRLKDTTMIGTV
jgi:hypothetical protein